MSVTSRQRAGQRPAQTRLQPVLPDLALERRLAYEATRPDPTMLDVPLVPGPSAAPGDAENPGDPAEPGTLVAGMDEVGRGALAGPVSVGVAVVRLPDDGPVPAVRDSKALSPARRTALIPQIRAWVAAGAVGHAGAEEIDRYGLTAALALAGRRAWHRVCGELQCAPVALVLDGRDNWLGRAPASACRGLATAPPSVHLQVKADARCVSVAAASILAKVERDAMMTELHGQHPAYGWNANKGYGAAVHRAALAEHGTTGYHRRSWNLTADRDC